MRELDAEQCRSGLGMAPLDFTGGNVRVRSKEMLQAPSPVVSSRTKLDDPRR